MTMNIGSVNRPLTRPVPRPARGTPAGQNGRTSSGDRVSLGTNRSTTSTTRPQAPAPPEKKDEKPGPLKLTASDLKRPLGNALWCDAITAIDPEADLQTLVAQLFENDPAAAASDSFELSQAGDSNWKSVNLTAKRNLSHGQATTTSRIYRADGRESQKDSYIEYSSQTLPTVQQLPEAMQSRWAEVLGESPQGLIEGVEEKLGDLGKKSKYLVYMSLGGKYGSFHFKAGNPKQPVNVRITKHETNLDAKLTSEQLEGGAPLPGPLQKAWGEWGFTPKGLARRLLSGSGVHTDSVRAGLNLKGDATGPKIALELLGDDKNQPAGDFIFSFFKNEKTGKTHAYHDLLSLKDSFQGKDTAKTVLRNNFRLYDELGMDHVDLTAAITVGGYAWARYGWQLKDNDWNHENINKQVEKRLKELDLKPSTRKTLRKLLKSNDPKKLWTISDMRQTVIKDGKETTLGKALLLGTNWQGTFDLKDADSRRRLEHYIGA